MIRIAFAEETPTSGTGLKKHTVAARIGRAIRYAVLEGMHVYARADWSGHRLLTGSGNDFFD